MRVSLFAMSPDGAETMSRRHRTKVDLITASMPEVVGA
jgi:hypothetical protein